MVTKRACCGWGSLGGLGWTGLGWVGLDGVIRWGGIFWAKTKDETDKTDWTEGIEAPSGKQPFPFPPRNVNVSCFVLSVFLLHFIFLRLRLLFFFSFLFPLSHFLLLFTLLFVIPKSLFYSGPNNEWLFFCVVVFELSPVGLSLPIYLPTYLHPSNSAGKREMVAGERWGQGVGERRRRRRWRRQRGLLSRSSRIVYFFCFGFRFRCHGRRQSLWGFRYYLNDRIWDSFCVLHLVWSLAFRRGNTR